MWFKEENFALHVLLIEEVVRSSKANVTCSSCGLGSMFPPISGKSTQTDVLYVKTQKGQQCHTHHCHNKVLMQESKQNMSCSKVSIRHSCDVSSMKTYAPRSLAS